MKKPQKKPMRRPGGSGPRRIGVARTGLRNAARPPSPHSGGSVRDQHSKDAAKRTLKTFAGAAGAALACAWVAREKWLSAPWMTAILGGVGGLTGAIAHSETLQDIGNGVMSAAGAQFGLLLIDHHEEKVSSPASGTSSSPVSKKPANVESLPPGALESAYERARRRLALSEAASQMAAA